MSPATYALNRGYLTPNPREEADAFVGPRRKWAVEFVAHVKRIIQSGRTPKAVIYGALGIGKTHFMTLVAYELRDVAKIVYVETPPLHRRSKLTDLHNIIMRRIGRDYSLGLLEQAIKQSNKQSKPLHETLGVDPDLATIFRNGLTSDKSVLWRYMSGEKLSAGEVRQIDAVSQQIREDDAVLITNMIARIVRAIEKKQLIVFIDEFENTTSLMGDSLVAFREGVRGLVDESNEAGIVISNTAREMDDMPYPITDESVQRRIGFSNYRLFPEYTQDDLKELIYEIIALRRDRGEDVRKLVELARKTTKESVTERSFPFTENAIQIAVNTVAELRQLGRIDSTRPKEALDLMDNSIALATDASAPLIDSGFIETAKSKFPLTPRP